MKYLFYAVWCLLLTHSIQAQKNVTLSGYVKDADSGEDLIYANVYNENNTLEGVTSNLYGFYSLPLKPGKYTIVASYVGYSDQVLEIDLTQDTSINFLLADATMMDSAIVVEATKGNENVQNAQLGTISISESTAKKIPALMGEVDILKVIQLLPGVLSAGEGNSGFYVRGGGVDQNLILLDEAVVYNSGHLLGFFSVFNADAIKLTTLIKGGMPANYGGRLSSVLDIQMKDGDYQHFGVDGGIGLVSSRLTVQGPIVPEKASFIVSGRRTYLFDLAQPFLKNTDFEGTNYYFYDLNVKANYKASFRDRFFLSGYFGRDVLDLNNPQRGFSFNMPWGNATATLRWNHLFNDQLFMNTTLIFNDYDFAISGGQDQFSFKLSSGIRDFGAKLGFDYYPSAQHQIKFGYDYTYHIFTPNVAEAFSGDAAFIVDPDKKYSHEMGVYILDDWEVSSKFRINYGVRGSLFQQVGPYSSKLDTTLTFGRLEPVTTYMGIEPRMNTKLSVGKNAALKAGITLSQQYVHLVSSSTSTLPTDLWVPSSEIIKPQWGFQYALGYFQNFLDNSIETSVEVYYKDLYNQLDYAENFTQTVDTDLEDEFITGRGRAYGIELFVRKTQGQFTGWVGYTLARSVRIFEEVKGTVYPASFDRTHDLSVVGSYDFNDRLNVSATFVLGSGAPYTPVKSVYLVNFNPTLEYGLRNSARLPTYHRLDLSASYKINKPNQPFQSTLVFSIYNAYNRRNVFFTYVSPETNALDGTIELKAYKVSLFPIIPSITWNFSWKSPKLKKKK